MSFLNKCKNFFGNILFVLFIAVILTLSVRGLLGNPTPTQLNTPAWKDNGPFELSPERGRFSLLYSLAEDHSFYLQPSLANFTTPDVGYLNGHFVSIFAPSISFIAIPGYIIGKYYGVTQFGTFLWLALFALLNVLLIRSIAIRLGANSLAATIAGITFLFATPAYSYAVTIYEHHVSTLLILLSLYLLISFKNIISLIVIWILYAFAASVDYPNAFMMLPIAFAAFFRSGSIEYIRKKIIFNLSLPRLFTILVVIIPFAFLMWVNLSSYGSPFRLSGTVPTISGVTATGDPIFGGSIKNSRANLQANTPPSGLTFFKPRNMLNGFYILLVSPDRGVIMYTPIVLFGIIGLYFAIKKHQRYVPVMVGVIGLDLILYSMWGDPYGGWAFGARYLIPAYAILAIYIAIFLTHFEKKRFFIIFFYVVFVYSILVNALGALTSNSNPPQIQVASLQQITHREESYTYMRNFSELNNNLSKSFIYQTYANNYFSAWQYYSFIVIFILIVTCFLIMSMYTLAMKKSGEGGQNAL